VEKKDERRFWRTFMTFNTFVVVVAMEDSFEEVCIVTLGRRE
jgi:hypothetical protein